MIDLNMNGKTVFVSGGTSGINLGIAECFIDQGCNVFVVGRKQEKLDKAVEGLNARGKGKAAGACTDVREYEGVKAVFQSCADTFGEIDVLVSGAAGNFPALANGLSPNGFKSVIDIDLVGTFHVMRAGYPHLRKPGARVINISAPQAWLPMSAQIHVCAAKAGVDMCTKTLAMEWGPAGVTVNSISPGPIDGTEGMERLAPTPELKEKTRESVPAKRLGTTHDIGNAALMFASDMGAYISGVVLPVDGGWSLAGVSGSMQELTTLGVQMGFLKETPA